jgi:peptide/nickel transport system substrate-binding protein
MEKKDWGSSDSTKRRKFLMALGLGGAATVAGCLGGDEDEGDGDGDGDGDSTGDGTGDTDGNGDGGSGEGGEIAVTRMAGPSSLSPILETTSPGYFATQWMYSNLTHIVPGDEGLEVIPDLATDWESNDAADEWTFMLRDNAIFNHNGEQVTAEDVQATFETYYDADQEYPGLGGSGPIDTVEGRTVREAHDQRDTDRLLEHREFVQTLVASHHLAVVAGVDRDRLVLEATVGQRIQSFRRVSTRLTRPQ